MFTHIQTAEIIATQLGGRSVGIVKDSRMRERVGQTTAVLYV